MINPLLFCMVGLSNNEDVFLIAGLVILAPLILIIGIPILLAAIGANVIVVILGAIINIALVGYFIYRWDLINILKEAFSGIA